MAASSKSVQLRRGVSKTIKTDMSSYGEEVLERHVEIMLEVDNDEREFFPGRIKEINIASVDGDIIVSHHVFFEDGDKAWFDLEDCERDGFLRWPSEATGSSKAASPTKRTLPNEEKVYDSPDSKREKRRSETLLKRSNTVAVLEEECDFPDFALKKRPRRTPPRSMPANIDAIIRYMDKVEPGEDYFKRQQDSRQGE
jgi:hypothetical protein